MFAVGSSLTAENKELCRAVQAAGPNVARGGTHDAALRVL